MAPGPTARAPAKLGVFDLLHLGAKMGAEFFRGNNSDPAAAGCRWAREAMQRDSATDMQLSLAGKTADIVGNREHSDDILAGRPGPGGYQAGSLKTGAMSFLAPHALTIADGEAWLLLRPFNEQVLATGAAHPFAQQFLEHVRAAFARPVATRDEVGAAMGRAMVKIVLGQIPDGEPDPARDVSALFDVVQSPLRRKLLGFLYSARRARLYDLLARRWSAPIAAGNQPERTLISLAREAAPATDRATLLEQVPHWMFTFTGSGTDLLTRTLCLVTSRPDVHARVLQEIRDAGPVDRAETIGQLHYLHACVLETGRLFPPVTRTFHRRGAEAGGGDREIVQYFPLLQRDDALGATVHAFVPERWLAPQLDAAAAASNLFLRGPRACPGMDLILFVCKAAAARLLGELRVSARDDRLSHDPLPVSFPKIRARFTAPEGMQ